MAGAPFAAHAASPAVPSNRLAWNTNSNRVSADIRSMSVNQVLAKVAAATGWQVFIEPGTSREVSVKFRNAESGEALRLLLGDLSYALVPGSNNLRRFYVFRSSMRHATEGVAAAREEGLILNELVLRLKPGANADEIARSVGGKVVGKMGDLNIYRVRFENEDKANAARQALASNPNLDGIENNYVLERPPDSEGSSGSRTRPIQLAMKPPPANGKVVVGLIDTAVQPLGNNLDKFLLKPVSVAGPSQLDPKMPTHGTAMAETMLRSLEQATKGSTSVQILPVDVYGPNPVTSTFDVANGVIQAVNSGATVINLSLGSEIDSPYLRDVIREARRNNITVFAAAGNEPVTTPFFPAAYPEVLAVTAVDNGKVADYANRGDFIALGAPGSHLIYYQNQPFTVTGTSAASAFTAGVAASALEAGKTPAEMTAYLRENFGMRPLQPGEVPKP